MNRDHALPGFIAIALAILFPVYWIPAVTLGLNGQSLMDAFRADLVSLSASDGLFVLIGLMEIYVLVNLRRILLQRLDSSLCAALLALMAFAVGALTATVLFDVFIAIGPDLAETTVDRLITTAAVVHFSISFMIGLLGLILSIALLVSASGSHLVLKLFAVLLLVCSLLHITIVLAPISLLVYPIALLALAIYFLRGEHEVEVI